jgi:hypothetical protein
MIVLAAPAALYGWQGNLDLLAGWYRTVTGTTAENLLFPENISYAALWQRWIGAGAAARALAAVSSAAMLALAADAWRRRRDVTEPDYLEVSLLLLLVPLLSPQGWDYVLVLGVPAYVLVADRWTDLGAVARVAAVAGFAFTSFTIFDLLGREVYARIVWSSMPAVGVTALALVVVSLRWRRRA